MQNRFYFRIAILLFLIYFFSVSSLQAVGVQPLVIDLQMERGETQQFQLKLMPTDRQEVAELNLYYPRQQITGALSYEEGDLEQHAVLNWIDLPSEATVPPGEKTTVTGEVSVPFDASGSHTAVIMVEPRVEEAETGITFRVRYAVRLNIHVDAPGLRESIELLNFGLEANEEDRPVVKTHLRNDSSLLYSAAGEVTIRDESRRLVQRIPIRSQQARQGGREETRIYPGSEVIFSGEVTEPLQAGTYDLQLFLRYADGRQIIRRKQVEVGDEFVDPERMDYFSVEPVRISEQLRKGGAHTEVIEIRNRTGEPIQMQIGPEQISSEYERSLLDNFELQLRGSQQFELAGRRSERPVLIVRSPRELADGGYYDRLKVMALDPDSGVILQAKIVDLEFLVGDEYQYNGEVQDITAGWSEEEIVFSATVVNTGDAHFAPRARVYLRRDEEIQHTLFLEMPEEGENILPGMTGLLTAYVNDIEPGEYTAEVTLQYQEEEISQSQFTVEVGPEVEEE